ncbi:division/cell wall cluster transcriptional repressor MraZ [Marinilabiliaceae bacterium JC017]|nr:division/cell wall cluster transcriptional repressor MraZ [Marinilabiliaceae bacterium JC017]
MAAFIGDFRCKSDAKGRIVLPSAFKKIMLAGEQDRIVVRKDLFENCLILYPYKEWEAEVEKIRSKINFYKREHTRFQREFFKGLAEVSLDGNGRFLIPKRLMEQVGAEREVVLIGVDKHIELWSEDAYEATGINPDELGDLAEKILGENSSDIFA